MQVQKWKMWFDENGMQLNTKKMECMECGPKMNGTITINSQELTKSIQFKYLGSKMRIDGDTLPDEHSHVNAAWLK